MQGRASSYDQDNAGGSTSSSASSTSGSVRRSSRQSGQAASTSAGMSASNKWKAIRPWQPPDNDNGDEGGAEDDSYSESIETARGQQQHFSRSSSGNRSKRMQLEVVDVSSTSVSLAVVGTTLSEDWPSSSTSTQRDRAGSTSSAVHAPVLVQNPPNISIKLNQAPWPHVFYSDGAFTDAEQTEQPEESDELDGEERRHAAAEQASENSSTSSSILVWGLSPGIDYRIELGVEEPDEDEDGNDAYESSESTEGEDSESQTMQAATSVRTLDMATEPDVPPPPYSSHDPSLSSHVSAQSEEEIMLRSAIEKLRTSSKQAEAQLQSLISALRRSNDKLTREDQRHRQRIHMLEENTSRLLEVASEEDSESQSINEEIAELEELEYSLGERLEWRRGKLEEAERQSKESSERDDAELNELRDRLEKAQLREEETLAKKLKMEREQLPTYNIQLATLEADLRRALDDQRRHFGSGPGGPYGNGGGYGSIGNASGQHISANVRSSSLRLPGRASSANNNQNAFFDDNVSPAQHASNNLIPSQVSSGYDNQRSHMPPSMLARQQQQQQQQVSATSPNSRAPSASSPSTNAPPPSRNFLPVGLRKRSSSLQKSGPAGAQSPTDESAPGLSPLSRQSSIPSNTRKGEEEPKQSSRFAWSNPNSWAAKVAGGKKDNE